MNIERLKLLRDFISIVPKEKFNMDFWCATIDENGELTSTIRGPTSSEEMLHTCGTVACLGGWTEVLFDNHVDFGSAHRLLGLTEEQGNSLFHPDGGAWWAITREDAVSTIDRLIETGDVVWPEKD